MSKAQLIHLVIIDSNPVMERLIAVSPETTCGEMAQLINAAFGFELVTGHFSRSSDGAMLPTDFETKFSSLSDPLAETIHYTPGTGRWCVSIYDHGLTELDRPLPQVIDASGPDVFQPAFSAETMEQMLQSINMLRGGYLQRQKDIDNTLNAFPGMSADQIHQRLSQCHVPMVAERVWFAAQGQSIYCPISDDRQPTGLQLDLGHHVIRLLGFFEKPHKLTKKGKLRTSSVREYAELINANTWRLTAPPREEDIPSLPAIKRLFLQAGLIEVAADNTLTLTEDGREATCCVQCATEACIAAFPIIDHEDETGRFLELFAQILCEPQEGFDAIFRVDSDAGKLNGTALFALHAIRPNGALDGLVQFRLNAMGRELLIEILKSSTTHELFPDAECA